MKLDQIIDKFILLRDYDDIGKTYPRYKLQLLAKDALKDMKFFNKKALVSLRGDVPSNMKLKLPEDFDNWIKVSYLVNNIKIPIAYNTKSGFPDFEYLQDVDNNVILDDNGNPLLGSGSGYLNSDTVTTSCSIPQSLEISKYYHKGSFVIQNGYIIFSSDLVSSSIVIDYISNIDLLDNSDIDVPDYLERPIMNYMFWQSISRRGHVPLYEKQLAKKEYYNSRRLAKRAMSPLKYIEIIKELN